MAKKSTAYWKNRFGAVESMMHKRSASTVAQITPAFDSAQAQIQKEIESWYQRFANNNQISLQEAKVLLNNKELKELKWDIDEYIKYGRQNAIDPQWMKELENASAKFHISRLEALQIRTQNAAERAFGNETDALDSLLESIYTDDYYHTAYEIQKGLGIGFDIGQIDQKRLDRILKKPWTADAQTFSDRIWKSKAQLLDAVDKNLTQMCILGGKPDDAIKNISHALNVSKAQAGRLVMTESAYFASEAQKECFEDLDVEMYEILATLDSRTSEICQMMDGKHFPMKDYQAGVTAPPFHPWCRSTTIPYFDDEWGREGTRAARGEDGKTYQVPATMTYEDWKKGFVDGGSKTELEPVFNNKFIIEKGDLPPATYEFKTYEEYTEARNAWRKMHPDEDVYSFFVDDSKFYGYGDKPELADRIKRFDATIHKLETEYPISPKYGDHVTVGTFKGVEYDLTDVQRERMDPEGLSAQAQHWLNMDDNKIVIAYQPEGNFNSFADDLRIREEKIAKGEKLLSVFDNSPEGTAIHEWGHGYSEFIADEMVYENPAAKEYWEWYKSLSKDEIKIGISDYAATNRWEFEAECFAELQTDNPRPIAVKFGEYLERCKTDAMQRISDFGVDAVREGTAVYEPIKDFIIGKSVGAKSKNYDVVDKTTNIIYHIVEGTKVQNASVFAGFHGVNPLNEETIDGLVKEFGGNPEKWQHAKGIAILSVDGEEIKAEIHWFQEESVGKVKFKVKRWMYDES